MTGKDSIRKLRKDFSDIGVVCVRGALDQSALEHAGNAYRWALENPGPFAGQVLAGSSGAFFQDHANPQAFEVFRPLLFETRLRDIVSGVLDSENLWLLYEQIWLKEGGGKLATPWHQDLPYVPLEGDHVATVWINLEPVRKDESLEFVAGSHREPLFNPTAFDPDDASAAMFADGVWPSLPDIEATRDQWPLVSWAIEPGDIVIFHMATLHGGAATQDGRNRRTISLRFFGDHAYCADRPESGLAEIDKLKSDDRRQDPIKQMSHAPPGTLFRHPGFHKIL